MKKVMLLITVFLLPASAYAQPQEKKLGVTFDLTYMSRWVTKGFEGYKKQGATFGTIDLDFFDSGFGAKVTHRNATSSGFVDKQRFDYRPYYKNMLFDGENYQTNYNISVGYEHYYGLARNVANTTYEWIFAFSWPNICPKGIVPRYIVHYEYPAGSNYVHHDVAGWVHRFGLGYNLECPQLQMPFHLSAEIVYNDGLGGKAVEHDWSHATFGLSTKYNITENLIFVPGIYHQLSMEDSVNTHDVTYAVVSMKYKF